MKTWSVLLGLVLGVVAGIWIAPTAAWPALSAFTDAIGTVWINAIRMTVVPLVASITVTGIASGAQGARMGRLAIVAMVTLTVLLLGAGFFALLVGPMALGPMKVSAEAASSLRASFAAIGSAPAHVPALSERLIGFVPSNVFASAAEGAILPIVITAALAGFALRTLDEARRRPLVEFTAAVGDAMMVIVRWVLLLAPIGVFALGVGLGGRMGIGAASAVVRYMAAMCAICLAYVALLSPVAVIGGRISARDFAAGAAPAWGVGLSTRSSFAALPAMVTACRERFRLPESVTGFVLPLVVSVGRMNVPITWVVGVLFLSRLYGVQVPETEVIELVFVSTLLSFSVPGIPSGSLLLFAPILPSYGIPAEAIGIMIAVDTVPDMFKTLLSVQGHLTTVCVAGAFEKQRDGERV